MSTRSYQESRAPASQGSRMSERGPGPKDLITVASADMLEPCKGPKWSSRIALRRI